MIVLLNGAFGIGKTVVARALVSRIPDSILFDPEMIGVVLQRTGRLLGRPVEDFQDLASWRRLTVLGLRAARAVRSNVVVPMAFSNVSYLREVREGVGQFEPQLFHFCLVAPLDVVHARLRERSCDPSDPKQEWSFRRATECCAVHSGDAFAEHVSAVGRSPVEIANGIIERLASETGRNLGHV